MGDASSPPTFDFVIVGGGTSGCLLAHRLSHAPSAPSVLLVEAGGQPSGQYLREPFYRYTPAFLRPDLNHGYTSTPQPQLGNRVIDYTRGKGLGGSSILNFGVYLKGSSEDWDLWAHMVGDASWRWAGERGVQESFKHIEAYDWSGAAAGYAHLAKPDPGLHGSSGLVQVSLPPALEAGFAETMGALARAGERVNVDANSGDPTGLSIFPTSYGKEGRTTSAVAHLLDPPDNLAVWTGEPVYRLLFEGTKVVGVETASGKTAYAKKDVILCGGAIDTPKLLLLNGIGPAEELSALGIPVVQNLPGVGKQLHDHVMSFLSAEVDEANNNRYAFESSKERVEQAEADWARDQSGEMALYHSGIWGGFLKLPNLEECEEFKALDRELQEFLRKERTPHYEMIGNCILFPPGSQLGEGSSYLTGIALLMNAQSEGSITLASKNPEDKPVIDLGYLKHPYDRRVLREAIRETWTKLFENPDIKPLVKKKLYGPQSLSDADIDAFMGESATTVWHANGTVKMGKKDDPRACVDKDFKLFGVEGLRVADLSVCPVTTNNHTQTTAYLVGQKAAEKLIDEYGL